MRSAFSIAAVAACASVAAALPRQEQPRTRCGASPSESFIQKSANIAIDEAKGLFNTFQNQSLEIETYFHVVAGGEFEEDGNVTVRILNAWIAMYFPKLCMANNAR